MWRYLKSWFSKPKLQYPEIHISVEPNPTTGVDEVHITADWPENLTRERILDVYGRLLYLVQSGNFYNVFNSAMINRCNNNYLAGLPIQIDNSVRKYVEESQKTLSTQNKLTPIIPDDTDTLIYPSQVFQTNPQ